MSFEGNRSQFQTGVRYEDIVYKRPFAVQDVQSFAESAKDYGLPSCDIKFFVPTDEEDSIGFRISDGDDVSNIREIYTNFYSQFLMHSEYAVRDNCQVVSDEIGPYIKFRYKDIVIDLPSNPEIL